MATKTQLPVPLWGFPLNSTTSQLYVMKVECDVKTGEAAVSPPPVRTNALGNDSFTETTQTWFERFRVVQMLHSFIFTEPFPSFQGGKPIEMVFFFVVPHVNSLLLRLFTQRENDFFLNAFRGEKGNNIEL